MTRNAVWKGQLTALLILTLAGTTATAVESGLVIGEPWVREGPPNARVLAGYMVLRNPTGKIQTVVGASSPAFSSVEMHRTEVEEGVARMREQEQLQIPADGQLALEPGGYHLMLMGAQQSLRAGDTVEIVLELGSGAKLSFPAPVRKGTAQEHAHHHH